MNMTQIFNAEHRLIGTSRNLRGVFEHARKQGGVKCIKVRRIKGSRYEAHVVVEYASGAHAVTSFVDYAHAVDWAHARSAQSPRTSWWAGCAVEEL